MAPHPRVPADVGALRYDEWLRSRCSSTGTSGTSVADTRRLVPPLLALGLRLVPAGAAGFATSALARVEPTGDSTSTYSSHTLVEPALRAVPQPYHEVLTEAEVRFIPRRTASSSSTT